MFENFEPIAFLMRIASIIIALTFHEFAHGFSAYMLGDSTAKTDGRLSLNPLRHLDVIGFIFIAIYQFGWAKPVMVNPENFRNPKNDMAITAFAGPISNFLLAFVFVLIFYPFYLNSGGMFVDFLASCIYINIAIAFFNMIPIPPLDGSKVFFVFLPENLYERYILSSKYGMFLIIILVYSGFTGFISVFTRATFEFFMLVASKIYFFL